jgi:AcrR family transcriptional regulator
MTATSPPPVPARPPGRPRDPEVDRTILEATIDLLVEEGFAGLSIEAVAARAKVGKTTVYRRWPSKIPLVVDAIAHIKAPASRVVPDDMPTRDALIRVLSELVRSHGSGSADQILAGLVGEMSKDEELAEAVRTALVAERQRHVIGLIERGVARGEIRGDVDAEVLADLLGGPIVLRRLITGRPVTPRLVREIVTLLLDGAAP